MPGKSKSKSGGKPRPVKSRKPTAKASPTAKSRVRAKPAARGKPASVRVDEPVTDAEDWRDTTLARMRALIFAAEPGMIEERKWRKPSNGMTGVPVWSRNGIVCTGEKYAKAVKLTFAHGASLPDPRRLFNASLEGHTRRAIDIPKGATVDAEAFEALVRAAVAFNEAARKQ